jgi:hypothetical protein
MVRSNGGPILSSPKIGPYGPDHTGPDRDLCGPVDRIGPNRDFFENFEFFLVLFDFKQLKIKIQIS